MVRIKITVTRIVTTYFRGLKLRNLFIVLFIELSNANVLDGKATVVDVGISSPLGAGYMCFYCCYKHGVGETVLMSH